jgi:hypothetical protein
MYFCDYFAGVNSILPNARYLPANQINATNKYKITK